MTGALADAAAAKGATHWLTNVPEDLTKAGLRLQLDPLAQTALGNLAVIPVAWYTRLRSETLGNEVCAIFPMCLRFFG